MTLLTVGLLGSLLAGIQSATAASAAPLTQVNVVRVESTACGSENITEGQAQTRCDHGPDIKVYVLEIGYGREPHVELDGFEVDGTRTQVCAFSNGALTDCSRQSRVVGYLYTFGLAGKQSGIFTFSNTSINAPGNTLSAQLYIK